MQCRPGPIALAAFVCAGCTVPPTWEQVPWDTGVFADPIGVLSGTVQDAAGDPLPGAHLTTDPHGYEATTDANGRFQLGLPPDAYDLQVAAGGYVPAKVDGLDVSDGTELDVQVPLQPVSSTAGTVRIVVAGPKGAPVEAATVTDSTGQEATTDTTGTAELTDLGGQVVDVAVAAPGGALWGRTVKSVQVGTGQTVDLAVQLSGKPPADAEYVGTALCMGCHYGMGLAHLAGPHGQALSATVGRGFRREFAHGTTVQLAYGTATLVTTDGTQHVLLTADADGQRDFVVAGVIGDDHGGSVPWTELGDQAYPLPVAWVAADPDFGDWPETAARVVPFQESTWIDQTGHFTFPSGERPSPALSADARCFACHASGFTLTTRGDGGVDLHSLAGDDTRWMDGFVGCERCHGPGSAHTRDPLADGASLITEPWLLDEDRGVEVCAQCHSRTEGVGTNLPYPYSTTGGLYTPGDVLADHGADMADLWAIGAAAAPNEQADELKAGPHGGIDGYPLRCWDCHEPHNTTVDATGAPMPHLLRLEDRDDTLCLSCHVGFSFEGDLATAEAHPNHFTFDPAGPTQGGRCVRCHMPRTAARLTFHDGSGAGDLSSHLFTPIPPQEALDVFADQGTDTLPVGSFPTDSCAECHAYETWRFGEDGLVFPGPRGDPTRIETHQAFQQAFEGKFP